MKILNVHRRFLPASPGKVGALLDSLSQPNDSLWPFEEWVAMRFDRPLGVGADGGHGRIRYVVEAYEPSRLIRFRFKKPEGFEGFHAFDVAAEREGAVISHVIDANITGQTLLLWLFFIRPLHDSLIEEAFDKAEQSLFGAVRNPFRRSLWVKYQRWRILRHSTAAKK